MKLFPRDYVWGVYFEQALQQLHVTSFFRNGGMLKVDENFQFPFMKAIGRRIIRGWTLLKLPNLVRKRWSNMPMSCWFLATQILRGPLGQGTMASI